MNWEELNERCCQYAFNRNKERPNCTTAPDRATVLTCFNPLQKRIAIAVRRGTAMRSDKFIQELFPEVNN
jgi:hypothetical protein